ncbi:hypothetical protein BT69DRAFT_1343904 [Atractiella rhizophila]|nr:hypothetical protein BT69DRAFT_1343904 [Atractiella rhizophila]
MPGLKLSELSPEEKTAFQYLFKKADTDGIGVVTGDKAVPFFSHSNLPPFLLGEIWQMSDDDNKGFLTEDGFFLACRTCTIGFEALCKYRSATFASSLSC